MNKQEAMQQGYVATSHIAFSAMWDEVATLLKRNKVKEAKELVDSYGRSPLYWYQKGGTAVAVKENPNAQNT